MGLKMTTSLARKEPPKFNPSGMVATTRLTLYREEKDYKGEWAAPAQSVFSNGNGTSIFLSSEDAPKPVWNETRGRYECKVGAESISIGYLYNLPEYTITQIVSTNLKGFLGVENEEPCIGGQDPKES
jgi:hypothetical protein